MPKKHEATTPPEERPDKGLPVGARVSIVDATTGAVLSTGTLALSGAKGAQASAAATAIVSTSETHATATATALQVGHPLEGHASGTSSAMATGLTFIPDQYPHRGERPTEFAPGSLRILSDKNTQAATRAMWAPEKWQRPGDALPYFTDVDTGVQVFVNPGGHGADTSPEAIAEASRTVLALDDRNVSAFLICMGKWLAETGGNTRLAPARIHVADVLGFRGIKKHVNGGYRPEQKEEAKQDIQLLRNILVRSRDEVWETSKNGKRELVPVEVDGPLLEVSVESTTDLWGERSPYAFRVRPGDWAKHYLSDGDTYWTTRVLRQIMQYHPYHDRLTMRLGIYLAFQWRIRAKKQNWRQPFHLSTLLDGAKIEVPKKDPQRFFPRVEEALHRLQRDGVVSECVCLDPHTWPPAPLDGPPKRWIPQRLKDRWRLLPPADVLARAERQPLPATATSH